MGTRYFATRFNGDGTETILDWDVPLMDTSVEDAISAPNSMSGTISPEIARLKAADGEPLFQEWSTGLYAETDGDIRGGGILTFSGFEGPKWQVETTGLVGYLKDMPYTGGGNKFVEEDTLNIARFIWTHVQAQPGGDVGLTFDQRLSGVKVGKELESQEYDPVGGAGGLTLQTQAYKLAWYQDHDLLANFDDLAANTPFDYYERHFWDGDTLRHHLDFGVPRLGRRRSDLRFVVGENIFTNPAIERNGEDYADEVYALGAGEGALMKRGHAQVPRRKRLRRVAVVSDPSMRQVYQANNLAAAELAWRSFLDNLDSVTVTDHPHAPIGSVGVGDEIHIQGPTGWVEIDAWYRVLTRSMAPGDSSAMDLSIVRTDRLAA